MCYVLMITVQSVLWAGGDGVHQYANMLRFLLPRSSARNVVF